MIYPRLSQPSAIWQAVLLSPAPHHDVILCGAKELVRGSTTKRSILTTRVIFGIL